VARAETVNALKRLTGQRQARSSREQQVIMTELREQIQRHPLRLASSATALYETVRDQINARIAAGVYAPGAAIPSTAILSREFEVSEITVKRAIRDLQASGVLTSIPRKGVFVKEQKKFVRALDVWMTSLENIRHLGFRPRLELISITRERQIGSEMGVFGDVAGPLLCVRKKIFAGDLPLMYDVSYVPVNLDHGLIEQCSEKFIYDVLVENGFQIPEMNIIVDAAPASPAAETVFAVPTAYPMLRRFYRFGTADSAITVVGVVESPFDRVACSINLTPPPRGGRRKGGA
jgi:DNA-binding GntR family transcriptional regulator